MYGIEKIKCFPTTNDLTYKWTLKFRTYYEHILLFSHRVTQNIMFEYSMCQSRTKTTDKCQHGLMASKYL